jgi:hypothetical protein
MSRMIQARVSDEQYDWLIERAIDEQGDMSAAVRERGDMSAAIRDTIDMARIFVDLLRAQDPPEALRDFLKRSEEEQAQEEAELES